MSSNTDWLAMARHELMDNIPSLGIGEALDIYERVVIQHEQQAVVDELKSLLGRGDNALTDRIEALTKEQS